MDPADPNIDEADFEDSLRRRYGPYFEVAEELLEIAREMAHGRPMMFHSAFDGIAAFFFARSYKTFLAVVTLARKGLGEDAAVLARGLVENAANLFYIALEPDRRADLYLEYEYVARNKYVRMLEQSGMFDATGTASQAPRQRLQDLYESVKANYPNENLWAGMSMRQMAAEVGLTPHYIYAYKYFSDIAHGGPSTVSEVLEPGEQEGFIGITFGPDEAFVPEALLWSCDLYWRILAKNDEIFSIDFDKRLKDEAVKMRGIFRAPGTSPLA